LCIKAFPWKSELIIFIRNISWNFQSITWDWFSENSLNLFLVLVRHWCSKIKFGKPYTTHFMGKFSHHPIQFPFFDSSENNYGKYQTENLSTQLLLIIRFHWNLLCNYPWINPPIFINSTPNNIIFNDILVGNCN
jgi:hypothetical protein